MKSSKLWHRGLWLSVLVVFLVSCILNDNLLQKYRQLESVAIKDRHGENISLRLNSKGQYAEYNNHLPPRVAELLLEKEDRFFYFHAGVNPFSIARAALYYFTHGSAGGSSTISQQLVKNLLGNEGHRTLWNKLMELIGTIAIEFFNSKTEILIMYANTVYMGNGLQGLATASQNYFGRDLSNLTDSELVALLATLSSPTLSNPWKAVGTETAPLLAKKLGVDYQASDITLVPKNISWSKDISTDTGFELASLDKPCVQTCTTTLDKELTDHLRTVLKRTIDGSQDLGLTTGAIVVIKEPENQLLALIGTPQVDGTENGQAINMAVKPRPIGSTAKPFIYLAAFEKGLRPYTLVNDREYKFSIGNGLPFYPKNYDGLYRGWVTLHYALSNSLNIPAVKTLEYVGLSDFYYFLEQRLGFKPLQDLDSYQYGIALGGLEMDPLTLAHNLTLFPNQGILKPLQLYLNKDEGTNYIATPMSSSADEKKITETKYAELVTRVLNDRKTGVDQFGLRSNLNLSQDNYAVKTGTSRDYHDSWTVGYTPDFVVAVWVGNAENTPLEHITGQSGAGRIWNEAMELLFHSDYNKKTPLNFSETKEIAIDGNLDFALLDDVIGEHKNLMTDKNLIVSPHDGDNIIFKPTTMIPLVAPEEVDWYNNGRWLGRGTKIYFTPVEPGRYSLKAVNEKGADTVTIQVINHN